MHYTVSLAEFWRSRLVATLPPLSKSDAVLVKPVTPESAEAYFNAYLLGMNHLLGSHGAQVRGAQVIETPDSSIMKNDAITPAVMTDNSPATPQAPSVEDEPLQQAIAETIETPSDWFKRLKTGLSKTRGQFAKRLSGILVGQARINPALLEEIESELLVADVGLAATDRLVTSLTEKLERNQLGDSDAVFSALKIEMQAILEQPFAVNENSGNPLSVGRASSLQSSPFVLLVIGVNGAGKTTTIGKLAHHQVQAGRSVLLAAGDTFRAAAVEQLKVWASRLKVPIIAQDTGADSASVLYDAFQAAKARGVDLLIADTAGRLHNKSNLMAELQKTKRVLQKLDPNAPHGVLLVLDAGNGQNALSQAKEFHEALGVDGVALTKLDGTAKGGISFAIAQTLNLPIWYIGIGEKAEDLREFEAAVFVDALLDRD